MSVRSLIFNGTECIHVFFLNYLSLWSAHRQEWNAQFLRRLLVISVIVFQQKITSFLLIQMYICFCRYFRRRLKNRCFCLNMVFQMSRGKHFVNWAMVFDYEMHALVRIKNADTWANGQRIELNKFCSFKRSKSWTCIFNKSFYSKWNNFN